MNAIQRGRLMKLANHLLSGKLGHEKFDFNIYNDLDDFSQHRKKKNCGTAGCAIGECPFVFPRHWFFDADGSPIIQGALDPSDSGERFFGLSLLEYDHLFTPLNQMPWLCGGKSLGSKATPKQVARNILAFIKKKDKKAAKK